MIQTELEIKCFLLHIMLSYTSEFDACDVAVDSLTLAGELFEFKISNSSVEHF